MSTNNDEWLKGQCNRYVNGFCSSRMCIQRGGWVRGQHKPEEAYPMASCKAHEVLCELEKLRAQEREQLADGCEVGPYSDMMDVKDPYTGLVGEL